jgi:hypothetical protein
MATEIWSYQDQRLGNFDLTGFEVETRDGVIGRVDRASKDVSGSYLVINAGPAMPLGRRIVLPAGVVETVDLDDRRLAVSVGRSEILSGPEYDPGRPLDESLRNRIGSHFASPGAERRSPGRTTRPQPAKSTASRRSSSRRTAQSTKSKASTRTKAAQSTRGRAKSARGRAQSARGRAQSARSNEPTKEQLYKQAKRLNIDGRSKMNKAQLKRAVDRRK